MIQKYPKEPMKLLIVSGFNIVKGMLGDFHSVLQEGSELFWIKLFYNMMYGYKQILDTSTFKSRAWRAKGI